MDIETQLQFINEEIGICDLRKTKLQSIRDSLNGSVQAAVSSIAPLIVERDSLKTENTELRRQLDGNKDKGLPVDKEEIA